MESDSACGRCVIWAWNVGKDWKQKQQQQQQIQSQWDLNLCRIHIGSSVCYGWLSKSKLKKEIASSVTRMSICRFLTLTTYGTNKNCALFLPRACFQRSSHLESGFSAVIFSNMASLHMHLKREGITYLYYNYLLILSRNSPTELFKQSLVWGRTLTAMLVHFPHLLVLDRPPKLIQRVTINPWLHCGSWRREFL